MFISVASSMLTDADLYHSQPCVEVWNFPRLYGYWAPCDESKWFFSIFNHTDLIRAECDKCSRAPKWLLRFELWQEQCRWLLCSHTGGILSFSPSSRRTEACWILPLTQWQSLNGTFLWSNFPCRKIIDVLFGENTWKKMFCFNPITGYFSNMNASFPACCLFILFPTASLVTILFLF